MTLADFVSQIQKDLSISTVSEFIDSPYIKVCVNKANLWACGYKPWPFMEKAEKTATTSDEYYDYPDNFLSDSISMLRVEQNDGKMKRYKRLNYEDYMAYREDSPSGAEKLFSDHDRYYFINPNPISGAAGRVIEIWGQEKATALTDALSTPFAEGDAKGEEAVKQYAENIILKNKLKEADRARMKFEEARLILDEIWSGIAVRQSAYHRKDKALFERIDILKGSTGGFNRNQF